MNSGQRKSFVKGMTKGASALGLGLVTHAAIKMVAGTPVTINLDPINPTKGAGGFAGFAGLVAGLAISGHAEMKQEKSGLKKLVGYGILAAIGSTLDPDAPGDVSPAYFRTGPSIVPRSATLVPEVAAEYRNWIPQYAPDISFPLVTPSTPTTMITNVSVQVPRYSNLF